jgi:hypothetical protein
MRADPRDLAMAEAETEMARATQRIKELDSELALYRSGWRRKTIRAVAEEIRGLRAVASMEFERGWDTTAEAVAYQLGVNDVQHELRRDR